ncbi:T9SS type A sorting domain-containing protein [Chryseobacterium arthrosphaerae]|uniref:T9SS type A sorting domain-containing protein n=1 Tax=Chryseobacterium arthrosphaerae TaxID=651561 RepID=UPI0023E1EDA1|nr:T9SS type A sorting domain-containing protein [Chryseobacterium arthrosphaerae]WES97248.1 T9SS type A sorting domain-containing protein [Chryseobacterium arthrosphaerae]
MKFFYFLILLFFQTFLTAQVPEWVVPIREIDKESVSDMVTGSDGSIYAVGLFEGQVDFDPGPDLYYMNTWTQDKGRIFCIKLTPNGNLIWAKQMGGNIMAQITDDEKLHPKIAIDAADNIYITGMCFTNVDLDPSSFSSYFIPGAPISSVFRFVGKYNSNGNFIWAKKVGGDDPDVVRINSMKVDPVGNIYMGGDFRYTIDVDPGPGVYNLTTDTLSDMFFMKLDTNGNFAWAKQIGSPGNDDKIEKMVIDGQNIYITGYFKGQIDFDPGSSVYQVQSHALGDAFVGKYKLSDGGFQWVRSFASNDFAFGYAVDVDETGNVYSAGTFKGTVDFNPDLNTTFNMTSIGPSSIYFLKLNSAGQFVWVKNFGAMGTLGFTSSELPHSVAVKGDKVYLAGHFLTSMDCNPDDNLENWIYANGGNDDIFFIALNTDGNFLWATNYGGELYDYPYNIYIDANNDILLSGRYSNKVNFYPGVSFAAVAGVYDGFLLKLKENAYLNLKTDEYDFTGTLKVYPNPASDILNIISDSKISKVTVNSAEGKLLLSKRFDTVSAKLNIKDLPAGVYFVNITTGSKSSTQKIIKK